MTMDSVSNPMRKAFTVLFPWLIAAGAFALYLFTINPWVSWENLLQVARTSGWFWQEELSGPLYWLASYPLRWLPARLIPISINLFSAVCAALTLALLARSVMILPHDRTHEQRLKEKSEFSILSVRSAWLPPLFAALVCGLQLTFWQNATLATSVWPTGASNEMFDLLLFAYILRCLLESRIDEKRPWLIRAAFVYGLSIPNNWAMIAFFPLFLAALIWLRRLSFFNLSFLTRMFLWGSLGLLLYLLLPLVQSLSDILNVPFWTGLTTNIKSQFFALKSLPFNKPLILSGDKPLWVLGLSSLLPVLVMSVRWPSYFGDPSKIGVAISTFILQIAHAALMLLCLWVALGSQLSPVNLVGLPLLTLYFLGALSVGYFAGYFLLVFSRKSERSRRIPGYVQLINVTVHVIVWALLIGISALLFQRNYPQIRDANGPVIGRYAALLAKSIPKEGAVLMSDDPRRLHLIQAYLAREGVHNKYLFLESSSLEKADYHKFLTEKYQNRWPVDIRTQSLDSGSLIQLMSGIVESNQVYYLHPSFGYYFEAFYAEPHGMTYKLNALSTNTLLSPPLSEVIAAQNETFWMQARSEALDPLLEIVAPAVPRKVSSLMKQIVKRGHLITKPNADIQLVGTLYSRCLVYWGAELQKNGNLTRAAECFELAQQLNPENVVATINLACNKSLQSGEKIAPPDAKAIEDQFGKYRRWSDVINANGPFDDPSFCFEQGRVFVQGGLLRQAAQQFARTKALAPENLRARLWLGQLYLMAKMPQETLKLVKEIYAQPDILGVDATNRAEVLSIEASALLARDDVPAAETAIRKALKDHPDSDDLLGTAARIFINHKLFTNALAVINDQLKVAPDHAAALRAKGFVSLQTGAYSEAIAPLSRVIAMETNNFTQEYYTALLNRGIAYLRTDKLDEAQRDYEVAEAVAPRMFQIHFGLGEIAWRKHDTNNAIRHYQLYLSYSPDNPEEIKQVNARLKDLKPGSP